MTSSIVSNVTLSIVSHDQLDLVMHLLSDLERYSINNIKVVLTLNVGETLSIEPNHYSFPVKTIQNLKPKGFGANHNYAFQYCDTDYFCVLNPDIQFIENPFPTLIADIQEHSATLIAPKVINPDGYTEDSVRKFPSPWSILKKFFLKSQHADYSADKPIRNPDWIGGMFMLFKSDTFEHIGGFDEGYFLYYEDVDICRRLHEMRNDIVFSPNASVVHFARRSSHKNFRYLIWHMRSMMRFFIKWQLR